MDIYGNFSNMTIQNCTHSYILNIFRFFMH
jgi:hypothetical protein